MLSAWGMPSLLRFLFRFPLEVERQFGNELPPGFLESMRELVNVRPALATPLWVVSQLHQNHVPEDKQRKIKNMRDEMSKAFLKLEFIHESGRSLMMDIVDGLELVIRLTDRVSFRSIDSLGIWIQSKFGSKAVSYAGHALKEEAFLDRSAHFVIYGHTHHHEVVPLDSFPGPLFPINQIYLNSGTWHPYFDHAINHPEEQKFIPNQVITYLSFDMDDQNQVCKFETWSGAFSL
jgi:hypothetical protein